MDFRNIVFYVKDVKNSIEFYEKAFGLKKTSYYEEQGYGEVGTNKTFISFLDEKFAKNRAIKNGFPANDAKELPAGYELIFMVEDIDKSFEKAVKAGAIPVLKPTPMPWGQTLAYVRDINGILISLGSK